MENEIPHTLLVEMQNGATIKYFENSLAVFKKSHIEMTSNSTPGYPRYILKRNEKMCSHKNL